MGRRRRREVTGKEERSGGSKRAGMETTQMEMG